MTTFSELERAHEARVYETTVAIKQGRAVMAKILMGEAVAIMAQLEEMRERSGCKLQILDLD